MYNFFLLQQAGKHLSFLDMSGEIISLWEIIIWKNKHLE